MKSGFINAKIRRAYLELLKNLSPEMKLDIIKDLRRSLKASPLKNTSSLKRSFGAFKTEKETELLIKEIRDSRTFNRQIEEF